MDIYSYVDVHEEILQQMPAYLLLTTPENKIAFANNKTAQLLGATSSDDIAGTCLTQVKSRCADDAHLFSNQNNLARAKNKKISTLGYHHYFDWQLVIAEKKPLIYKEKVLGVITNWFDITNNNLVDYTRFLTVSMKEFYGVSKKSFSFIIDEEDISNYHLTDRQMECLFFLLRGKSSKEIAGILGVSPRTVEDHVEEIKLKMDCVSKSQLIEKSLKAGLFNVVPRSFFRGDL